MRSSITVIEVGTVWWYINAAIFTACPLSQVLCINLYFRVNCTLWVLSEEWSKHLNFGIKFVLVSLQHWIVYILTFSLLSIFYFSHRPFFSPYPPPLNGGCEKDQVLNSRVYISRPYNANFGPMMTSSKISSTIIGPSKLLRISINALYRLEW